jgi:hypothetical protein
MLENRLLNKNIRNYTAQNIIVNFIQNLIRLTLRKTVKIPYIICHT